MFYFQLNYLFLKKPATENSVYINKKNHHHFHLSFFFDTCLKITIFINDEAWSSANQSLHRSNHIFQCKNVSVISSDKGLTRR
jgi:hypothetical protein